MKAKNQQLLLHPLFIVSLVVLLLNDLYGKYEFHNGLTGKLSDFAGLFAFSIFLLAFFYQHKKAVILLVALLFIIWKSPISSPLISFFNNELHIPVYRVIDYSDYIALLILPAAYYIKPVQYTAPIARQIAIPCIGVIAVISFMADSLPKRLIDDNKIRLDEKVRIKKKSEAEVINALRSNGINAIKDTAIYEREFYKKYFLKSIDSSGKVVMTPAEPAYDGVYTKITYGSIYTVPELHMGPDTLYNLQFDIGYPTNRKIWLHSFTYKSNPSKAYGESFFIWKRVKKPLKKKFKAALKRS